MKDLRERCEKFVKSFSFADIDQRAHCCNMLEFFAREIRNEALEEAEEAVSRNWGEPGGAITLMKAITALKTDAGKDDK